ncbi:MAG: hypothetical protein ABH871_03330 [Pseudomonadota bacterium]
MTTSAEGVKSCKQEGCKRPYKAKGFCNVHYKKWRRGELDKPGRYRTCAEESCHKPTHKKGYCEQHYSAWSASKKPQEAAEAKPAAAAPAAEAPKEEPKAEEKPAEEKKE